MAAPEKPPISVGPYVMNRRHVLALGAATLGSAWLGVIGAVAQAPTHPLIAVLLGGSQATVERWLGGFP